ncbi:MAG: hypothetical protein JWO63_3202 [Frankiales bacterium]|nr:hypothetical protein [Frankiales bacterium]
MTVVIAAFGAAVVGLSPVTAAPAGAVTTTSPNTLVIGLFSTWGAPTSGGSYSHAYDYQDAAMGVPVVSTSQIAVGAGPSNPDADFFFDLYPAAGHKLGIGDLPNVGPGISGTGPTPALEIVIGSTVQNVVGTDVDILDLAADSAGKVTRFDLVFRTSPARASNGFFGEIRYGEPAAAGQLDSATTIQYPQSAVDGIAVNAVERVRNTSGRAQTVGALSVAGNRRQDFTLHGDTCTRARVPANGTCWVTVSFRPLAAGPSAAILVIPMGETAAHVELDGNAPVGVNEQITSGSDYVDLNRTWDYKDGPYQLDGAASANGGQVLGFAPTAAYDESITPIHVVFSAPTGQRVTAGIHQAAPGPATDAYEVYADGEGRGCGGTSGQINVKQVVYGSDGALLHADIAFTQWCTEAPADKMTGEVKWRVESDMTGPGAVARVRLLTSGAARSLSWVNPTAKDYRYTLVRLSEGSTPAPTPASGRFLYLGASSGFTLPALGAGVAYTATFFTVDTNGNVSPAGSLALAS